MVLISKRHVWSLSLSLSLSLSFRGIKYSCNYDGIINSRKKLQTGGCNAAREIRN